MNLRPTLCLSLLLLASALAASLPTHAADPVSLARQQALANLRHPDLGMRRQAVARLALVGQQKDTSVLLEELLDPDLATAKLAEAALWKLWNRSGDKTVDAILSKGMVALNQGMLEASVQLFNEAIKRKPAFAEAWNKRATAYFLMGEYKKSLEDCDQVLKRNPSHFGALAGYGQIYLHLAEPRKALAYFERALSINPNLDQVALVIDKINDKLSEQDDQTI
jgi:tetratricopeptide (TPR) repeat protein